MKQKSISIIKLIPSLITLISVLVSVFIYVKSGQQHKLDQFTIARQAQELFSIQNKIKSYQNKIDSFSDHARLLERQKAILIAQTDSLFNESQKDKTLIDQLYESLNDTIDYMFVPPGGQLDHFLKWTNGD